MVYNLVKESVAFGFDNWVFGFTKFSKKSISLFYFFANIKCYPCQICEDNFFFR